MTGSGVGVRRGGAAWRVAVGVCACLLGRGSAYRDTASRPCVRPKGGGTFRRWQQRPVALDDDAYESARVCSAAVGQSVMEWLKNAAGDADRRHNGERSLGGRG